MTRGNQREKAREKNLKKQADQKKKQEGDPRKRLEAQAAIMREKQKAGMCIYIYEISMSLILRNPCVIATI